MIAKQPSASSTAQSHKFPELGQTIAALPSASGSVADGVPSDASQTGHEPVHRDQAQTQAVRTWPWRRPTVQEVVSRLDDRANRRPDEAEGSAARLDRLTDFDREEREVRMRTPMQIPASWQSPILPKRQSWLARQTRSAAMGLILGLAIALPAVAIMKTNLDVSAALSRVATNLGLASASPLVPASQTVAPPISGPRTDRTPAEPTQATPRPLVQTPSLVREAALPRTSPAPTALPPSPDPSDLQVAVARRLIKDGDVAAARVVLSNLALAGKPAAIFLLAETFDPMTLAAWGARGVDADVARAIELYETALEKGMEEARPRLRLLRPN